ncbi:MAG: hypothetical protein KBT03_09295 [Bacteroidales bacterium]|nr:hypothetical protein [Candidatus Scybalousia scybalohippi]
MIVTGKIADAQLSLDGRLRLILDINEKSKALTELEIIKECEKLNIKIEKYHNSRSLSANAYLWQLLDKMAKVLGSDKDTMYLLQLSKYGVFTDLSIKTEALPVLKQHFRYVEEIDEGYEETIVRCYYGSSGYDTKEMSYLIEGTVRDAKELGIDTLTPDELDRMLNAWKGDANGR